VFVKHPCKKTYQSAVKTSYLFTYFRAEAVLHQQGGGRQFLSDEGGREEVQRSLNEAENREPRAIEG